MRPRSTAIPRRYAAASSVAFDRIVSGRSSPPAPTGAAAPIVVAGAIAAICAAAATNVPADVAPAPDGATYTTTGSSAANISSTISRVDEYSPPGVFNCTISRCAPAASASSIALPIRLADTGSMASSSTSKCAICPSALAPPAHAYSVSNPPTPKTRIARAMRYLIPNSIGKPRQCNPSPRRQTCHKSIIEHCPISRIPPRGRRYYERMGCYRQGEFSRIPHAPPQAPTASRYCRLSYACIRQTQTRRKSPRTTRIAA